MSHRRRYPVTASRDTVVDLLALDPLNPRSIAFHIDEIREQVSLLPGADVNGQLSELSRAVLRIQADLSVHTPQSLGQAELVELGQTIGLLTNDLHAQFLD